MSTIGAPNAERERFTPTGGGRLVQTILPLGGAAGFFVFTMFLLGQPAPMFLFAVMPAFFGALMFVGGVAAFVRGDDPTAIEVGPDGVWLPGLGWRHWADFHDVRVEHATGPSGSRVAIYRRLGFVPLDPTPAERLPFAERLASTMVTGFYRFTSALMGNRPVHFAPFGVQEVEIGSERFDRLLALVEARVAVGREVERPAGEVEPNIARPPGYLPRAWPAMLMPASRAAALGFGMVLVVPGIASWAGGVPASFFGLVVVGAVALGFVIAVVVDARRARAAGADLVPLVVLMLLGALGGAVVAILVGPGFPGGGR